MLGAACGGSVTRTVFSPRPLWERGGGEGKVSQTIKTSISLEKTLFDQAETAAREMKVSRSRLFAIALQDFLGHQKNRELLAEINKAWDDEPDATEKMLRQQSRRQQRRLVGGE